MARTSVRDTIDLTSANYARAWDKAQRGIVKLIDRLTKQGKTAEEIGVILGNTDFTALVGDLGMTKELKALEGAYRDVLLGMKGRHALTEATLGALQSFTRDTFLAHSNAMPARLKTEVVKALLGGGRTSDVAAALQQVVEKSQAETLAATALQTYSRSVGYEMAKQDPPDQLYIYEGPVDDVTRDICLEMAAAGELTLAEIEDRFPGAFVDGGGFNCRHQWQPAEAAVFVDPEDAQDAISAREEEGTWREPLTVRERINES